MRKIIAVLLTSIMLVTMITPAFAIDDKTTKLNINLSLDLSDEALQYADGANLVKGNKAVFKTDFKDKNVNLHNKLAPLLQNKLVLEVA